MFFPADLTDEQLHTIWTACVEMTGQPTLGHACQYLSDRLVSITGAPSAIFRRDSSGWSLIAGSLAADGTPDTTRPSDPDLDDLASRGADVLQHPGAGGHIAAWTPVPLDEHSPPQVMLVLPGNWRLVRTADWLPRFAKTASMALRLVLTRQAARHSHDLASAAYSFARALGQTTGERALHQIIVDTAAKTVGARLGSLAVYRPRDQAITISATHGYPSEAVGHVRIAPGSGVIGGIFTTKRPLLVKDTRQVPGLVSRSRRYQTASFMAVPIISSEDTLGVLTLADRSDGRAFTHRDLAAARLITTVSSLALVRQQLTRLADELSQTAAMDPLTGMFNRRYLQSRLVAELERSRRTTLPVAVMMLDVDGFKRINDQLGHQRGDAVLRKVSEVINRSMRASDVCTRYGGDEFAIIVAEHAPSAPQTAERIRHRVAAFPWDTLGVPEPLHITISIGIATSEPAEAADSLLGRADQHLYEAKSQGRNRVYPAEE